MNIVSRSNSPVCCVLLCAQVVYWRSTIWKLYRKELCHIRIRNIPTRHMSHLLSSINRICKPNRCYGHLSTLFLSVHISKHSWYNELTVLRRIQSKHDIIIVPKSQSQVKCLILYQIVRPRRLAIVVRLSACRIVSILWFIQQEPLNECGHEWNSRLLDFFPFYLKSTILGLLPWPQTQK